MGNLTIQNLDEDLKTRLRIAVTHHGNLMEEEARDILHKALNNPILQKGLGTHISERFKAIGGVDLDLPERGEKPRIPDFEK